jgi:hypothetical protein
MLIHQLLTSQEVERAFGVEGVAQVHRWLTDKVLFHEKDFCLWNRSNIRCFDEYMNNVVEAMNKSAKKSDISAKPNMNMDLAAQAMNAHTQLQQKDRRCNLVWQLNEFPGCRPKGTSRC